MSWYRCDFKVSIWVESDNGVDLAEGRMDELADDLVNSIKDYKAMIIIGGFEIVE